RELGLFKETGSTVEAMVALMDESLLAPSLQLATRLRAAGIATEAQLEPAKVARQLRYADRAGIRFVVLLGSDELARGVVTVKDMLRQTQFEVGPDELAATLQVEIEQARAMGGVPQP